MKAIVAVLRENVWLISIGAVATVVVGALASLVGLSPAIWVPLLIATLLLGGLLYWWRTRSTPADSAHLDIPKVVTSLLAAALVVLVAIQAVPYGREQTNPPVTAERIGLADPGGDPGPHRRPATNLRRR